MSNLKILVIVTKPLNYCFYSNSSFSANVQDSLVPQEQNGDYIGEIELEYNEHPESHYKLDTYVDYLRSWMP